MLIVGLCFDICDRELIVVEMLEKNNVFNEMVLKFIAQSCNLMVPPMYPICGDCRPIVTLVANQSKQITFKAVLNTTFRKSLKISLSREASRHAFNWTRSDHQALCL